jgi:hypothetical protein
VYVAKTILTTAVNRFLRRRRPVAGIRVTAVVDNPDREARIVRLPDRLHGLESVGKVVPVEDHNDHECAVRRSRVPHDLRSARGASPEVSEKSWGRRLPEAALCLVPEQELIILLIQLLVEWPPIVFLCDLRVRKELPIADDNV